MPLEAFDSHGDSCWKQVFIKIRSGRNSWFTTKYSLFPSVKKALLPTSPVLENDCGKRPCRLNFLACVGSHLWCYDTQNRITAIRLRDGIEDAWLCPGPFTIPVTNRSSERLILASPRGLLASFRPRVVANENFAVQPSVPSLDTKTNVSNVEKEALSEDT